MDQDGPEYFNEPINTERKGVDIHWLNGHIWSLVEIRKNS